MRVEIALKFIYQILLVLVYNVSDFRLFYVFLGLFFMYFLFIIYQF